LIGCQIFSVKLIIAENKSKAFKMIKDYDLTLYLPEDGLLEFKKQRNKLERHSKEFELKSF